MGVLKGCAIGACPSDGPSGGRSQYPMLDATAFQIPDLSGLSPEAAQAATQAIEAHVNEQALQISRKDQELKFKNAKLEKLTFELARHKAWRFGAKTERMNAEQRQIFEETLA